MAAYKVVLVGDARVGKTSFLRRYMQARDEFSEEYVPTIGVEVYPLVFQTSHGSYTLNIWDIAGQEKFGGLRDSYYTGADGVITMCATNDRESIIHGSEWSKDVERMAGDTLKGVVGVVNKSDITEIVVEGTHLVSTKNNEGMNAPFLELLRKITGHDDLTITSSH